MFAVVGETVRLLIAAAADVTVTDAAAWPPVDATAVIVTLPEATAVTRHVPPVWPLTGATTATEATAVLLDEQAVTVGGVDALPPVI